MAKLLPIEKQIIVTSLLAMYAECPMEELPEFGPLFVSIFAKLDLREALDIVKAAAKVEP